MNTNTTTSQSSAPTTAHEPKQAPSGACSPEPANREAEAARAEIFGDVIYSYSRAQALEDGYLVDVTETAHEAGFRCPVALTRAAWEDCVAWSEADTDRKHWPQDQAGRLWDVLSMARFYIAGATRRDPSTDRCTVELVRVPRAGSGCMARHVALTAVIGGGDDGEPVITIGQPADF